MKQLFNIVKKTFILGILVLFGTFAMAQGNALFEKGNALYNDGKFAEAIDTYQVILDSGQHSAELYFNIANAHYKLNNVAPSIYYYEKALQLSPNDAEIKNNLVFAQQMTIDAIDVVPEVGFSRIHKNIVNSFSFDTWSKLAIAGMVLFVVCFIMYYFAENTAKKRLFFMSFFVCLFLGLITLFLAFQKYDLDKNDKPAIVFSQETSVKSDPNATSAEAFTLHEGTKVQILETFDDWSKIELSDDKTGWMKTADLKAL